MATPTENEEEETEGADLSEEPDPHYMPLGSQAPSEQTITAQTLTQAHHEPEAAGINVASTGLIPTQSSNTVNTNNFTTSATINQTARK